MARSLDQPLDDSDFDMIEHSMAKLLKAEKAINLARSAGIDVGDSLNENREQMKKLRALRTTYFPNR